MNDLVPSNKKSLLSYLKKLAELTVDLQYDLRMVDNISRVYLIVTTKSEELKSIVRSKIEFPVLQRLHLRLDSAT